MHREPVRLVIWDLDETLWRGTLTEGGITEHVAANYEIVRELARRGIVSSICSKNDYKPIKDILTERDIWDYFVFPSISWHPKGPRIAEIVQASQLRPETILFIDDNHGNRAEAEAHVPGIQTADETIIPSILADALFTGKDDSALSRLAQYKILETRHADMQKASGDSTAFLRSSNIRVTFDYDVEANIDRAVELINRTNQLNFTKKRLPDDLEGARQELRRQLAPFNVMAALVRVEDAYGDYGFTGFFLFQGNASQGRLHHFCFSCRTIGMGIERWVYDRLQRPRLEVTGEVQADLKGGPPVDWINDAQVAEADQEPVDPSLRILLRGGCELDPLVHYFKVMASDMRSETSTVRCHLFLRRNSTAQTFTPDAPPDMDLFGPLGFERADFETTLFNTSEKRDVAILTFWADSSIFHYRHKQTSTLLCDNLIEGQRYDLTQITDEKIEASFGGGGLPETFKGLTYDYIHGLRAGFERIGRLSREDVVASTSRILAAIPESTSVIVVKPSIYGYDRDNRKWEIDFVAAYNDAMAEVERAFPKVRFIAMDDAIKDDAWRSHGMAHFRREAYFSLFEMLKAEIGQIAA